MDHILKSGEYRPGIEIRRVGLIVAAEPLHELRITVIGTTPGTRLDVCGLCGIGGETIQVVVNGAQLETWVTLQPLHQLPGVMAVVAVRAATMVVAVGVQQKEGWMLGIKRAAIHDLVIDLSQHIGVL